MADNSQKPLIDSSWYKKLPGAPEDRSAGGVIVRKKDSQIEVGLVRQDNLDHYIIPKGGIEPGEDPEDTAIREIEEEAGLTGLILLANLGTKERYTFKKTYWKTIYYFLFLFDGVQGIPTETKHVYACDWFPIDQLPVMFWPEQRELIEQNREWIKKAVEAL